MKRGTIGALIVATSLALALAACGRSGPAALKTGTAGQLGARAGATSALVANQDYLEAAQEALGRTGIRTVDVVQYNFFTDRGGAPEALAQRLIALHRAGTRVRVLLEGVRGQDGPDGAAKRNSITLERLRAAGIATVKQSASKTIHTKAICIDGRTLLLGSTNWTRTSIERNNETNARIDSQALGRAFTAYFEALWRDDASMRSGLTADGPTALVEDRRFFQEAEGVIARAQSTLDIATYYLAYRQGQEARDTRVKRLLDLIVARHEAARREGRPFRVRLFLDNNGIPSRTRDYYQEFTMRAAWNARNYLAEHGVTGVKFDRFDQISHCKFILGDGREVLFGSTNLYGGDFDEHHQINVLSTDASLAAQFARYMEARYASATDFPVKPQSPGTGAPGADSDTEAGSDPAFLGDWADFPN